MKLNKKVFAGALALAMGLGVVAPAAQSFAAPDGQVGMTEEYRDAEKEYVAAYKEYRETQKAYNDAKAAEDKAYEALQEATKAVKNFDAKLQELADSKQLAYRDLKKAVETYNSVTGENVNYNDIVKSYKVTADYGVVEIDNNKIVADTAKSDAIKAVLGSYQDWQNNVEANKAHLAKYDNLIAARDTAKKAYDDAVRVTKLAWEKYEKATKVKDDKKQAFVDEGADKTAIDIAEKYAIEVPEKPEVEEDLTEKIEASLKANKEKLSALKAVKKYMPESYKKYKKVIDEAVEEAEKAIKQAEDFLGKKVAFVTVAHASDATNEPTAEEVLKDLEESEKKLDDAMNQVEQDNKEQNEKEEENKEEEKPADKEENKEEENKEEKPEVTEKEDKTPSKNVKTGVAGVAGVGAVLAAASAAYVSSKRK